MRTATRLAAVAVLLVISCLAAPAAASRELSLGERLGAQQALERVYYAHQDGATRSLDEAVPASLVERKVVTYLKESRALASYWNTELTNAMLDRELARIAQHSRLPERLAELDAALGGDVELERECLARPLLADRLARAFFARDGRIHAAARARAELLRDALGSVLPGGSVLGIAPQVVEYVLDAAGARTGTRTAVDADDFARLLAQHPEQPGTVSGVIEQRDAFVVRVVLARDAAHLRVAHYAVRKSSFESWLASAFPGFDASLLQVRAPSVPDEPPGASPLAAAAGTPCPDTWDNGSLGAVPDARMLHSAVWTGSLMIVWGGQFDTSLDSGARYDPATDTWSPVSSIGAPSARGEHAAVWTGGQMLVWGGVYRAALSGDAYLNSGGRYDPVTDTWTAMATSGAPSARTRFGYAWTGSRLVVFGGWTASGAVATGAMYDPATDAWTTLAATNAPAARYDLTAVWTGARVLVWGGNGTSTPLRTGAAFDPATNSWTTLQLTNAPLARSRHVAVWTGSQMVVWGGTVQAPGDARTGGRYDPATDTWTATTLTNAPAIRTRFTAVWTGSRMIAWGGRGAFDTSYGKDTGGLYDPVGDTWIATSQVNAPPRRFDHTAVWTGTWMIVWGGGNAAYSLTEPVNSGGRFDPASNSWTPTATGHAPAARRGHTAVWTGNVMVVWGGADYSLVYGDTYLDTGGRYDPALDAWTATSLVGAPPARARHTAVWTGQRMIVWGGFLADWTATASGAAYDPLADAWSATNLADAPQARYAHGAVWTGTQMLVWGGKGDDACCGVLDTGAAYDAAADSWSPLGTAGAPPSARKAHDVAWTGSELLVWGGLDDFDWPQASGARYAPATGSWTPIATDGAPDARTGATAVWTGTRWIVWGGQSWTYGDVNDGARYDPSSDTWTPTALDGAPSARNTHAATWSGARMLIWGGQGSTGDPSLYTRSGGQYDPASDSWSSMATRNAPLGRLAPGAVWADGRMIVWGGGGQSDVDTGGRYTPGVATDADGDGYNTCQGDCDDANAAVHPGLLDPCNALDDDCDGSVDENFVAVPTGTSTCGLGACLRASATACVGGTVVDRCTPGLPSAETCNALDDDCDGATDNVAVPTGPPAVTVTRPADQVAHIALTYSGAHSGYDVLAGPLETLAASGGDFTQVRACLGANLTTDAVDDAAPIAFGHGAWYLARVAWCGVHGSWDSGASSQAGSRDAEIAASGVPCP